MINYFIFNNGIFNNGILGNFPYPYGITKLMNMSLSRRREIVKDREAWRATVPGVAKSWT